MLSVAFCPLVPLAPFSGGGEGGTYGRHNILAFAILVGGD